MRVKFGFLAGSDIYEAEIPDALPKTPEYTSPYYYPGIAHSEFCWLSASSFARFPLRLRSRSSTPTGSVEVYEHRADTTLLALCWRLERGCLWTQVEAQPGNPGSAEAGVKLLIERVSVRLDSGGIPRSRYPGARIGLLHPLSLVEREEAHFVGNDENAVWAVRFRNDSALGQDHRHRDATAVVVTMTTPQGVSVVCSGTPEHADFVEQTARDVARSVTRSRR